MVTKHLLYRVAIFVAISLSLVMPTQALFIVPDYDSFSGTELDVLEEAVKEWSDLLPCSDGKTVPIEFVCDNSLSSLGLATVWFKPNGDVDHARVTLDNDGLYWTLTDPSLWSDAHKNDYDALTVAKHEVGHAIGFIHGGNFLNNVVVDNGNRFYNLGGDPTKFDDNDFDLQDGAGWDGHAASSSDLMYYALGKKQRRHPTLHHAQVLGDAYGYCIIPDPASLTLALIGIGTVTILRRRKELR